MLTKANNAFILLLMAQRLKAHVREQIIDAARIVFAERGYSGATMVEISERAEVSAGNIYRYFRNKDALFYTVVPDELAQSLLRLLRRRLATLLVADDLTELGPEAKRDADELLRFWVKHRHEVIVLLSKSEGSRYDSYGDIFVDELLKPTLSELRRVSPAGRLKPVVRFTLKNIFANTVQTIVAILRANEDEPAIREAFEAFWSYQLAGLAGLKEWMKS